MARATADVAINQLGYMFEGLWCSCMGLGHVEAVFSVVVKLQLLQPLCGSPAWRLGCAAIQRLILLHSWAI